VNRTLRREKSRAILSTMEQQELIEKIKRLPQDRVAKVESFVDSLARRDNSSIRENLHQALTDYAIQHAGTDADFDPVLEAAATEHLLEQATEQ
jgi:superfamily II DNA helicase RecQ